MTETRLWEADHPYYCNEGNYYSNECGNHYSRWQDFVDSEGDSDMDYNLLFRWDFVPPREDGEPEKPIKWFDDERYRDCTLKLFWIGQRKGIYRYTTIDVCRADEPSIKEWLTRRWEYLQTLWAPLP